MRIALPVFAPAIVSVVGLLVAAATFAQQKTGEVWKWVDKNGVVHYSDQPGPPGSVKMDLRIQTYSPSPAAAPSAEATPANASRSEGQYQQVAIISPLPETTFRESTVSVSAAISPALKTGHGLRFELDGQPQGVPSGALSIVLNDVERGSHTVRVSIIGAGGSVVKQSEPVIFYVQQTSIFSPARKR